LKYLISILIFSVSFSGLNAQKPKDGKYTYKIAYAEWQGKSLGATCLVVIKGDSITILNDGSTSGEKGSVLDQGVILKHQKTGKWIIAHSPQDKFAKEIGDCSGGPGIIDFKHSVVQSC
jgi:hypothetical protein